MSPDDEPREQAEIDVLLRAVDHEPPRVTAEDLARRARQPEGARLRWAAVMVGLLAVAGVAYAIPGSPVRTWVRTIVERVMGAPAPIEAPQQPRAAPDSMGAGVAVLPGRSLTIQFVNEQATGQIHVISTQEASVTVLAPEGAATYSFDEQRLLVNNTGTADFVISIPSEAPHVEIRVAGRRVYLRDGMREFRSVRREGDTLRIPVRRP